MSPRSFPGGQVQGPHNSTHACLVPPLFWEKNPKCRLDYPENSSGWFSESVMVLIFNFQPCASLSCSIYPLSWVQWQSLPWIRAGFDQILSNSISVLVFHPANCWCVIIIAKDSNIFCFNFHLLIIDNQSFPFKVKHLSESRPRSVTLLSVTSRSIHSSKLARPGPGPRSLLPMEATKTFG